MTSSGGLHSLATIVKRLEAAATRLEDIVEDPSAVRALATFAESVQPHPSAPSSVPIPPKDQGYTTPPLPSPPSAAVIEPPSVIAFDERVIQGVVVPFVALTKSFASPSVIEMAGLVEKQFVELRAFINVAASCQKPDNKTVMSLLDPLQASIEAVSRAKEANRQDRDWFTHLTVLGEGAPSVGWVVSPKPAAYVDEIKDSVDYYANKVVKEFKDKNAKHVEWIRAFQKVLQGMRDYVQDFHTTGLSWNSKGTTVDAFSATPSAPPPPPLPIAKTHEGGAAAVFADLNRGEEVTKGLRKVEKSEMTHKNPALRAGSVVSASSAAAPVVKKPLKPSKPSALAGKKPSKFVLDGIKWAIEYQENESALAVERPEMNHSVNIFGCKNSTIVIKGKVNAVTIVNSNKISVLVDSVVSSISVTSSPSFTLQVTGTVPMIQIDSTDGGQIYLSSASLSAEITTAKCSAINVSLPVEGEEEGVFEEQSMPEMLRTVIKDGRLFTSVVEHSG